MFCSAVHRRVVCDLAQLLVEDRAAIWLSFVADGVWCILVRFGSRLMYISDVRDINCTWPRLASLLDELVVAAFDRKRYSLIGYGHLGQWV